MKQTVSILKALSDKNRLRIVNALLTHEELCACQITELLQVAGATASRHLSQMVQAGVLKNRKQGRWIYFRLNREQNELTELFDWVETALKETSKARKDLELIEAILKVPCEELSQKQRQTGTCSGS